MNSSSTIVKELLQCISRHDTDKINDLLIKDTQYATALAECVKTGYVVGISVSPNASGSFVFQELDNCSLTPKGSNFLQNS